MGNAAKQSDFVIRLWVEASLLGFPSFFERGGDRSSSGQSSSIFANCWFAMVGNMDFLPSLGIDMSFKILMSLDDPSDFARASCVSRAWHDFVVSHGLCKQLCLRRFPPLSRVTQVKELNKSPRNDAEPGEAISASSTDNFPQEGIDNTLETRHIVGQLASYWSSKGHRDPSVPETLIYKLVGDVCVITEIGIQPFEAYFQPRLPIYSARSVRFRVGYLVSPLEREAVGDNMQEQSHHGCADEKFVWTYTSPKFPMVQENRLQKFKLQEPVLCIGGFVLIELLGRVQRQEMDGLFYICMTHVQVVGQCLSTFAVESIEPSGSFVLKVLTYSKQRLPQSDPSPLCTIALQRRARNLEHLLNVRGNPVDVEDVG
ncbi:hypothetical protein MLD38_010610 [Melastoma candidum]|uniref:Uncharacterized protein n=1 Tax=Melastoma candidum TaxID=119954 RepID=A0ACB9R0F7_9MYRT|nr:hypothetical protein MLD38_010610 [Melastoma candidum]